MHAKVLIAGVAVAVLTAGASSAKTSTSGGNYAAPAEPIPYSQMDSYTATKAPVNHMSKMHRHKTMDMKSGASSSGGMGGGSDTSAATPPAASGDSMSSGAMSSTPATPPVNSATPPMAGTMAPPTAATPATPATPPTSPPN